MRNNRWRVQSRARIDRRSVVHIIIFGPDKKCLDGSGFVIKRGNRASTVATACHVLDLQGDVWVRTMVEGGVKQLKARVLHRNAVMDVAFLKVPGLTSVPALRFATNRFSQKPMPFRPTSFIGQQIMLVGYCDPTRLFGGFTRMPACSPGRVRPKGTCSEKKVKGLGTLYHVQLDCVSMSGMSGGPILSSTGVVGMLVSGGRSRTRMLSTAISPESILMVLKEYLGLPAQDHSSMEMVIESIP